MERKITKLFSIMMSLLLVIGGGMAHSTAVHAATGTVVPYDGSGGIGSQFVTINGEQVPAYCTNEGRAYENDHLGEDISAHRVQFQWNEEPTEYNAAYGTNLSYALSFALVGNLYDSNGKKSDIGTHEYTANDDISDGTLAGLLAKVLYYGYPNNAEGDGFSQKDTQQAIYDAIYKGKNYVSGTGNALLEKAMNGWIDPSKCTYTLYVYLPDVKEFTPGSGVSGYDKWDQALVNAVFQNSDSPIDPKIANTTVNANGTEATETSEANVEVTKGDKVDIKDTVVLYDLEKDTEYTLSLKIVNIETQDVESSQTQSIVGTGEQSQEITVEFGSISGDGTYTIVSTLSDKDGTEITSHNTSLDVKSETVIIKEVEDTPSDEETPTDEEKPADEETPKDDTPADDDTTDTTTPTDSTIGQDVNASNETPSSQHNSAGKTTPNTGDNTNINGWYILFGFCLIVTVLSGYVRSRYTKR